MRQGRFAGVLYHRRTSPHDPARPGQVPVTSLGQTEYAPRSPMGETRIKDHITLQRQITYIKGVKNMSENEFAKYTFDNYETNFFYHPGYKIDVQLDSIIHMAEFLDELNLPIFFYGKCGSGKTHILHAIENEINHLYPELRTNFVSPDQFINDYTECGLENLIRQNQEIWNKCYDADVVLVDDLFIERYQQEIIKLVRHFCNKGKPIFFTCHRDPLSMFPEIIPIRKYIKKGNIYLLPSPKANRYTWEEDEQNNAQKEDSTTVTTTDENNTADEINESSEEESFTFDNFNVDRLNRNAFNASLMAAKDNYPPDFPLFIWGCHGTGKTHLLRAIENEIKKDNPQQNVTYITGEEFSSLFDSTDDEKIIERLDKICDSDVLLFDDVQNISGRPLVLDEFYYVFRAFCFQDKKIVITSDKHPNCIQSLEIAKLRFPEKGQMVQLYTEYDFDSYIWWS